MSERAMRPSVRLTRFLGSAALIAMVAMNLAGCQTIGAPDITGSVADKSPADAQGDNRKAIDAYGEKYRANPRDPDAALRYGQALRANGQREQAVAVLEQANLTVPGNKALLGAYGRALADNGNFQQAFDVLSRAHTPSNPDWRILSIQGAVLDQLGRHEEARNYYASALKIVPDEPSVLSNLGLSYVLTKELPKAEQTLRKAYDRNPNDPRVRQNLGLALGLQGRFPEAEAIVKADLPPDEAAANVAYLKDMLNRPGARPGPQVSSSGPSNRS
jgi:Flp pilus assembly protein TadD